MSKLIKDNRDMYYDYQLGSDADFARLNETGYHVGISYMIVESGEKVYATATRHLRRYDQAALECLNWVADTNLDGECRLMWMCWKPMTIGNDTEVSILLRFEEKSDLDLFSQSFDIEQGYENFDDDDIDDDPCYASFKLVGVSTVGSNYI